MAAPRKRAAPASKPRPAAEPEGLDALAEDAPEGAADAGDTTDATPAEPEPARAGDSDAEQPCTECLPAGWPDDATSVGCGHGTWNRDL
jgi:hypothetical protein